MVPSDALKLRMSPRGAGPCASDLNVSGVSFSEIIDATMPTIFAVCAAPAALILSAVSEGL